MKKEHIGLYLITSIITLSIVGGFGMPITFGAGSTQNLSSQVIVGNAAPTVSAVTLNSGNPIVLTAYATTSVVVNFTVQDNNGCGDVFFSGTVTSTVFRAALGATCTADNLNCYRITSSSITSSCPNPTSSQTTANATATYGIYYFAQATDASSSFAGDDWDANVFVSDQSGSNHSSTATNVELNTLTAINVTTSSINYGTLAAGVNTASTNQTATTTNAGNSSTTLRLHALSTLTSGVNSISTSSQHYSTSSFTYAGTSTALTASAVTVTGFLLTTPTSTNDVPRATFWGLDVPGGTATGTYTGTNVFTSLWQP